jgi:hypothetical protein
VGGGERIAPGSDHDDGTRIVCDLLLDEPGSRVRTRSRADPWPARGEEGQVGPSGPISARQEPSHYLQVRIAAAALELILLHSTLSEGCNLFFGPSPILRKLHPFADDLSARLVFFHFLSLGLNFLLFSHHIREFNVGFESFWILRLAKHYPYHDVDNVFILHIRQLENGLERPRGR